MLVIVEFSITKGVLLLKSLRVLLAPGSEHRGVQLHESIANLVNSFVSDFLSDVVTTRDAEQPDGSSIEDLILCVKIAEESCLESFGISLPEILVLFRKGGSATAGARRRGHD